MIRPGQVSIQRDVPFDDIRAKSDRCNSNLISQ
jgi:hypothetical protein